MQITTSEAIKIVICELFHHNVLLSDSAKSILVLSFVFLSDIACQDEYFSYKGSTFIVIFPFSF